MENCRLLINLRQPRSLTMVSYPQWRHSIRFISIVCPLATTHDRKTLKNIGSSNAMCSNPHKYCETGTAPPKGVIRKSFVECYLFHPISRPSFMYLQKLTKIHMDFCKFFNAERGWIISYKKYPTVLNFSVSAIPSSINYTFDPNSLFRLEFEYPLKQCITIDRYVTVVKIIVDTGIAAWCKSGYFNFIKIRGWDIYLSITKRLICMTCAYNSCTETSSRTVGHYLNYRFIETIVSEVLIWHWASESG